MKRKRKRGEGCIYRKGTSKNYYIKFYLNGKAHYESVGSSDEQTARDRLKERMAQKTLGQLKPEPLITFEEMGQRVILDYKVNKRKSLERVEFALAHLNDYFGSAKPQAITTDAVEAYKLHRQEGGAKNATINRELAVLKKMYRLARLSRSPEIRPLEENNTRRGFFEFGEYLTLRESLPEHLKPVATFAFYTGCRKGEILSLKWSQVDLAAKIIRLNPGETKNGQGRVIGLDGELLVVLQSQLEKSKVEIPGQPPALVSPFVFHKKGKPIKDFRGSWKTALEKAELPSGRLFHDFRRTGVRNMIRAGVPERVAMMASGHKTRSVFDRYNIINEEDMREAARKTAEHLQRQAPVVVLMPVMARKERP